jgi:putative membrane protein
MLRLIVGLPLLLLIVLFALSNVQTVQLGLWPTGYAVEAPVSVAVLIGAALAFLLGALMVWVNELGQRRRARRAEDAVRRLEARLEEMRAQLARPVAPL